MDGGITVGIQIAAIVVAEIRVDPTVGILTDVQYGGKMATIHYNIIAGVVL